MDFRMFVALLSVIQRLTCNTNITAVMPGPIGQYAFKYALKGTQKMTQKSMDMSRMQCKKC